MRNPVIATALVALLTSNPVFAGGIGLFSDPAGTDCNITLDVLVLSRIYVLYLGQGGPEAIAAEYKIEGMPGTFGADYVATLVNAPGSGLNLGNAFDGTGHSVAWPAHQAFDANGNLLLASYQTIALTPIPPGTLLQVTHRTPPTNASFRCPYVVSGFDLLCQPGGQMRINGGANCAVAVEDKNWTDVRELYR